MLLKRLLTVGFLVALLYLAFPSSAYAYLDPGTGSYIFQLLLAGIVGLLFLVKVHWQRIKLFFTGLFSKDSQVAVSADDDRKMNGMSEDA